MWTRGAAAASVAVLLAASLVLGPPCNDSPAAAPSSTHQRAPSSALPATTAAPLIVAVVGATGLQGVECVRTLLTLSLTLPRPLEIRALTRSTSGTGARRLQALAEQHRQQHPTSPPAVLTVRHASLDDPATLSTALASADALFAVTFSDFANSTREFSHGMALGRAAVAAGVARVVLSGGAATNFSLLDSKARIEAAWRRQFAAQIPQLAVLHSAFFFENFVEKGGQRRVQCATSSNTSSGSDDSTARTITATFSTPFPADMRVVMHSGADIGRLAAILLLAPAADLPTTPIRIAGALASPSDFVAAFNAESTTRGLSHRAKYAETSLADVSAVASPAVASLYRFYRDGGMAALDSPDAFAAGRRQWPSALDLQAWMHSHGFDRILELCAQTAEQEP